MFLLAVAVVTVIAFASCKKCVTCSYEYDYLGQKQVVTYPQECGSSKKINDYKATVEADAQRHGVESSCVKD
ncbi:MAG TPA: hypothetical protein PLT47_03445 [Bacteroidales bacterium]|nr:hypothetical protein [Bacteroidales bacterium]HQI69777.1 hypothetical protein [Bacteroidales bacterium]